MTTGRVVDSREYFDALQATYELERAARRSYLDAVDDIVVDVAQRLGARTILDVGCGDGLRLRGILERTGATGTGIDDSPRMVAAARRTGLDAHVVDIRDLGSAGSPVGERFDIVIALWNVIGHLPSAPERRAALADMRAHASPAGRVVIDVNNRHNAARYGWPAALRNLLMDALRMPASADFVVRRTVQSGEVATVSHIFSVEEILDLGRDAGLEPVEVHFVDYSDGRRRRGRLGGQICVVATPAPGA